jgi:hypothetical protein
MDCQGQAIEIAYENQEMVLGYVPSDIAIAPASGSILCRK